MSSFLRRLNQLGFARVRDATDPNNLDVFKKPGFVRQTAELTTERVPEHSPTVTDTKAAVQRRLESPTSTLMFSPTMANENEKFVEEISNINPLNLPSFKSSLVSLSPKIQMPKRTVSSGSFSSLSTVQSSWVCSTPEPQGRFHTQESTCARPVLSEKRSNDKESTQNQLLPRTLTSMPPPIPICSSGGPVLLRARSESYESSPPPSVIITKAQVLDSPVVSSCQKTPVANTKIPLKLSPGTVQTLKLPNLEHFSKGNEIRAPPVEFVAECVRKLVEEHPLEEPIPMQVDEEFQDDKNENHQSRPKSPFLGSVHVRAFPKLQHAREYIRLCEAAEKEADAILNGTFESLVSQTDGVESDAKEEASSPSTSHSNCDASILAHVELLQGYKRQKFCEMSAE